MLIDATRRVCDRVYVTIRCPSICLFVCLSVCLSYLVSPDVMGLLLWAQQAGRRYQSTAAGGGCLAAAAPQHEPQHGAQQHSFQQQMRAMSRL